MTTTELSIKAADRGTIVISGTFQDENGDPVTPNSATWTLTNGASVVNERTEVNFDAPLSSSFSVVLTDADLAYADGAERYLVVDYRYDSDAGNDLRNTAQVRFVVLDVQHVV